HHLILIICSLCRYQHFLKFSSKSVHSFLSYFAHGQTDRQTNAECPSGSDRCMAQRVTTFTGKEKTKIVVSKGYAPASLRLQGSINLGRVKAAFTTKCCTTDLCNDQLAPGNILYLPNGKKCFGCDGTGFCHRKLDCPKTSTICLPHISSDQREELDSGFVKVRTKGCITKDFCQKRQLAELSYKHIKRMTCCQGDYCNRADSTGSSLLLLVVTGFSLVIFS
uniref:UPAR/Ly6 domain-containing protein n=1 Tax=Sphaeramia orbicularis TaxID=375764 RepID=A0A673AVT1_9TELE